MGKASPGPRELALGNIGRVVKRFPSCYPAPGLLALHVLDIFTRALAMGGDRLVLLRLANICRQFMKWFGGTSRRQIIC